MISLSGSVTVIAIVFVGLICIQNATTAVEASAGDSAQDVVKAGPLRNQAAKPSTPNRHPTYGIYREMIRFALG